MNYQDFKDARERIKAAKAEAKAAGEWMTKPSYNTVQNAAYMLKYAWKHYPSLLFWILVSSVTECCLTIANTYLPKTVVVAIESKVSLWTLVGIIAGYTLVLCGLVALIQLLKPVTEIRRILIRYDFYENLAMKRATTDYENLYRNQFNQLCNHASRSDRSIRNFYLFMQELLTRALFCVFFLVLLSKVNIVLLLVTIIPAIISHYIDLRMEDLNNGSMHLVRIPSSKMWYIQNKTADTDYAKDIRLFGMQQWLSDLYRIFLDMGCAIRVEHEVKRFLARLVAFISLLLRNTVAYAFLIGQILNNQMTVSDFVLYFTAITTFTQQVSEILKRAKSLYICSMEFCPARDVLAYPEHFVREGGKPLKPQDIPYEIKIVNLHYRYPDAENETLKGINLTIRPGEKLAVIGLNGAGKTTLVRILCGLLEPTQGQVLINGVDYREYNRLDYYKMFTALFQDISVLPNTIAENIAQQNLDELDMDKVKQCAQRAGVSAKIEALPKGYETPMTRIVHGDGIQLSGGQLQRLMLARALYKNAPLMVLDEPTAALDPIAESQIYQKYNELVDGKLSLFISHRLASTQFCDRIIMMEHGLIVEEGTHAELMKQGGKYAELFEIQSQYYKEGDKENAE